MVDMNTPESNPQATPGTDRKAAFKTYMNLVAIATERELTDSEVKELNDVTVSANIAGYDVLLGDYFTQIGPRGVTLELPITEQHLQPWGLANGGVYASLGETAGSVSAFIAAGAQAPVVGVNNNTDFYRSARAGDTVVSKAQPIHVGRTTQVWLIEHTRTSDGKTLARTNLRLQVLEAEK